MFYPYVMISAAQTRKSDDLRQCCHVCYSFFYGCAKNLGICEATKDDSGASSKNSEKKQRLWAASGGAFRLGCNWPSNAPSKYANPELRHSKWVETAFFFTNHRGLGIPSLKGTLHNKIKNTHFCIIILQENVMWPWKFRFLFIHSSFAAVIIVTAAAWSLSSS